MCSVLGRWRWLLEVHQQDTATSLPHVTLCCCCCAGLPVPYPPARPRGRTPPRRIRGEAWQECEACDVGHTFLCEPGLHTATGCPLNHAAVFAGLPNDVLCTPGSSTARALGCVGQAGVSDGDVCGWVRWVVEQQHLHGVGQLWGCCCTPADSSCTVACVWQLSPRHGWWCPAASVARALRAHAGDEGKAAPLAAVSHNRWTAAAGHDRCVCVE
jgi:hypothetical protein